MPTTLKREDDIDSAYDYSPTAQRLSDSENATSDSYINAGTDQAEAFANDPANAVRSQETSSSDNNNGWVLNRSGVPTLPTSSNGAVKILKKNSPLGLIVGLLVGGGFGMSVLFSPGILLVHIKEVLTNKFNAQETSMTVRYRKMIVQKVVGDNSGATKGICGTMTLRCKYNRMSNSMLKSLDDAGIKSFNGDVETSKTGTLGERPTRFEFTDSGGKKLTVPAADLAKTLDENPEFSAAFKRAFNPRFAGFTDSIFNNLLGKFKTSKADDLAGKSDEEMKKQIQTDVNDGKVSPKPPAAGEGAPPGSTQAEQNAIQAESTAATDAMTQEAEALTSNGSKASASAITDMLKGSAKGGLAGLVAGGYCMLTTLPKTIGTVVRLAQMTQVIRYGMIFMVVADKIKAGDATPEEVSLLGSTLTTVLKDSSGNVTKGSATDGFGLGYALFGDLRKDTDKQPKVSTYTDFVPGGGWSQKLSAFTADVGGNIPAVKNTCNFVNSSGGQLTLGLLSGWSGIFTALGGIAAGPLIEQAIGPIIAKLVNAMAGKMVDSATVGQDAGDALASGTSNMLAETAAAGGNAPLSVDQAVAYNNLSSSIQLANAREDQATHSPFDATNPNTFLGSITNAFLPYMGSFSSLSGMFGFATSSLGGIVPAFTGAHAFADANSEKIALTMCDDPNIQATGVAAGPFCNVSYGVPPQYMDVTPDQVLTSLNNQYDETTGDPKPDSELAKWINQCTQGSSNGADVEKLADCKINSQEKANYSLFFIDRRLQKKMDGEDTATSAGTTTSTGTLPTGDAKALANQILPYITQGKLSCNGSQGPTCSDIQNTAKGTPLGGNCQVPALDSKLLSLLLGLLQEGHTYVMSAICSDHSGANDHTQGKAMDMNWIDGVYFGDAGATGPWTPSIDLKGRKNLQDIINLVPANTLWVGQKQCHVAYDFMSSVSTGDAHYGDDTCHHQHISVGRAP